MTHPVTPGVTFADRRSKSNRRMPGPRDQIGSEAGRFIEIARITVTVAVIQT